MPLIWPTWVHDDREGSRKLNNGREAGPRDLAVERRRFGKGVIVVGGHRQAGEGSLCSRTGVEETGGEERRQSRREGRATNHKGASGVDLVVLVSGNRG